MEKQNELKNDLRERFDFSGGRVLYSEKYLKEDILQAEYPDNILLDVGYYGNHFKVQIIHNFNWQTPAAEYICNTEDALEKPILSAIEQIKSGCFKASQR